MLGYLRGTSYMLYDSDRTIEDMNSLGLNEKIIKEFDNVEGGKDTALTYVAHYINSLKYENGRKVRIERKHSMFEVLSILYRYATAVDGLGECSPAMRTIAYEIDPDLERIDLANDSTEETFRKEKLLAKVLMSVHRTIKALEQFGLIKIHVYRAETNRFENPENPAYKLPNFYYELTPVSKLSAIFAELLTPMLEVLGHIASTVNSVKESILFAYKKVGQVLMPHEEWVFEETETEKRLRLSDIPLLI
jgi:hypothetical protein